MIEFIKMLFLPRKYLIVCGSKSRQFVRSWSYYRSRSFANGFKKYLEEEFAYTILYEAFYIISYRTAKQRDAKIQKLFGKGILITGESEIRQVFVQKELRKYKRKMKRRRVS
jgi:hypothetical protein